MAYRLLGCQAIFRDLKANDPTGHDFNDFLVLKHEMGLSG